MGIASVEPHFCVRGWTTEGILGVGFGNVHNEKLHPLRNNVGEVGEALGNVRNEIPINLGNGCQ